MIDKKRDSMQKIFACAKIYEEKFRTNNILIVFGDILKPRYQEMSFPKHAFLHLTGVEVNMRASEFYSKCIKRKLRLDEFELIEDGTSILKLNVLPELLNMRVSMFGTYNYIRPKLMTDKLIGNIRGCLGFIKDEVSGFYVPNTTLQSDIRDEVENPERILFILKKDKKELLYNDIIYSAKKVSKDILRHIELIDYSKL